jgi:hypothetical protein
MIHHCPHLVLEDFLPDEELELIRTFAETASNAMVASRVTSAGLAGGALDEGYRRSQVAPDLEQVWGLLDERLRGLLPIVRSELGLAHFTSGPIERQMTVSRDGDFFKRHTDEHHPYTDGSRVLTFVYYFQRDDLAFEGGRLRLYAQRDGEHGREEADEYVEVVPKPNSIVFFPAHWQHEVTAVDGGGADVERWTVNGWFRAGDLGRPPIPSVTSPVRAAIASRVVPAVADGWTMRPTPPMVDRVLRARWVLGRHEQIDEADDQISIGGTRRLLPIEPTASDVLEALRPLHEAWAGCALTPNAAYGLRTYGPGQGIDLHVEHVATHVVSSLIVVDLDVDEPFVMTLAEPGRTHRVALSAGQMIIYEGARVPHGHLEPLRGRSATVLLLHYAPQDWALDESDLIRRGVVDGLVDANGALTTKMLLTPEPT